MKEKRNSFAGRISRKIAIWMFFIAIVLSYVFVKFAGKTTRDFYSEIYYNRMLITNEYTRRVISDVYVAVTNNIYYLEHSLDKPESHKETMARIVNSGTRVRSCGISFIEDYYPEKGKRFCPYAWRNAANPDIIWKEDMGDADLDYLKADWFRDVIRADSAQWSEPFFDSYDKKTPLSAYMTPIHDLSGRTVAVLGADISLDWLTNKLEETDSTINRNASFMASKFGLKSSSYIINYDGSFITHPEGNRIVDENFYSKIESYDGSDVKTLIDNMKKGKTSDEKSHEKFLIDGQECYVFYVPVKYTKWVMVTVLPCDAIDTLALINGLMLILFVIVAMVVIVAVAYYYMRNAIEPVNQLTHLTNDIAKGNLDALMPDMKHNDEIGHLHNALENMKFAFSNYVDELKRKAGEEGSKK